MANVLEGKEWVYSQELVSKDRLEEAGKTSTKSLTEAEEVLLQHNGFQTSPHDSSLTAAQETPT